jgi:hypothetical protein
LANVILLLFSTDNTTSVVFITETEGVYCAVRTGSLNLFYIGDADISWGLLCFEANAEVVPKIPRFSCSHPNVNLTELDL